jgi:hypothetical protein
MFLKNVWGLIASGGALYSIHKAVVKRQDVLKKVYFPQGNFHRNMRVDVRVYVYIYKTHVLQKVALTIRQLPCRCL